MNRGLGAVIGATALVLGWGVAHAQDASPGGIPGQAEPVAPATAPGEVNIDVKPQPTTTDTRIESRSAAARRIRVQG